MGGRVARRGAAGLKVARALVLVERLETDRRFTFVNHDNPWVARVDGGFVGRFQLSMGFEKRVAWSPDGQVLYCGGTDGLYCLDPKSGAVDQLLPGRFIQKVSVSADGSLLTFVDDDQALQLFDVASGRVTTIESNPSNCIDVDWNRNRAVIAQDGLYGVDLTTGHKVEIELPIVETPVGPSVVRPGGGGIEFLYSSGFRAAISPDGRIAYVKNLSELWLCDDSGDRQLVSIPGRQVAADTGSEAFGSPTWSPDSRFIGATLRLLKRPLPELKEVKAESDLVPEFVEAYQVTVDVETGQVAQRHTLAWSPNFAPCD